MLIGAKTARPCSIVGEIQHPVYRSHFDSPIVLLQASPGCLHSESLAGVLQERQREVIWLRFGAEDRDPANCLLSLVGAFGRFEPQAVEAARLLIHREPGPLYGWPRLYSGLAAGVRSAIQSPVTLVLQNTHLLGSPLPSLRLLGEHFLPHLPGNLQVVLTATATLALHAPTRPTTWISEKELLLDEITARRFFQQAGIELSSRALQRLMHLTQGKAGALSCLRRICEQLGDVYLNEIILNKRHFSQAMLQYVQDSLESMDRASVEALSVLASLGYDHPDFRPTQSDHPVNPDGAWATSLEGGWLALQKPVALAAAAHPETAAAIPHRHPADHRRLPVPEPGLRGGGAPAAAKRLTCPGSRAHRRTPAAPAQQRAVEPAGKLAGRFAGEHQDLPALAGARPRRDRWQRAAT